MRIESTFKVAEVEPKHEAELVHLVADSDGKPSAEVSEGFAKLHVVAYGALNKLNPGDTVTLSIEKREKGEASVPEVLGPEVAPTSEGFEALTGDAPVDQPESDELAVKDRGENPLNEDPRPDPTLYPADRRLQELPSEDRPAPNETSLDGSDLPEDEDPAEDEPKEDSPEEDKADGEEP